MPAWRYNLPPEATYLLPYRNRELGMLYMGARERARKAVHKLVTGEWCCTKHARERARQAVHKLVTGE